MANQEQARRRILNYASIFILVVFNLMLAVFLINTGRNLVKNTQKSHILEVSQDAKNEMNQQQ